jgi:hypothetical protein
MVPRARAVYSASLHSRIIDSVGGVRPFVRSGGGELGKPSGERRKVVAPDAPCLADHPACGVARFNRGTTLLGEQLAWAARDGSSEVTAGGLCHFRGCGGGSPWLVAAKQRREQGGGAFPRSQARKKCPGREPWNERRAILGRSKRSRLASPHHAGEGLTGRSSSRAPGG